MSYRFFLATRCRLLVCALLLGAAGGAGAVERISVATGGGEANSQSRYPAISADGRHVTFLSDATHLVAGDTNAASTDRLYAGAEAGGVYVIDLARGPMRWSASAATPATCTSRA